MLILLLVLIILIKLYYIVIQLLFNQLFVSSQPHLQIPTYVWNTPQQLQDHFYFVQEFGEFVSLDLLMNYQGFFEETQVKFYSAGILLALNYLHRLNIIHRLLAVCLDFFIRKLYLKKNYIWNIYYGLLHKNNLQI